MALNRLARIVQNIQHHLLKLMRIANDFRQGRIVTTHHFNIAGTQFITQKIQNRIEEFADVDEFALGRMLTRKTQKALHDFVATMRALENEIDVRGVFFLQAARFEQFGKTDHRGQRII